MRLMTLTICRCSGSPARPWRFAVKVPPGISPAGSCRRSTVRAAVGPGQPRATRLTGDSARRVPAANRPRHDYLWVVPAKSLIGWTSDVGVMNHRTAVGESDEPAPETGSLARFASRPPSSTTTGRSLSQPIPKRSTPAGTPLSESLETSVATFRSASRVETAISLESFGGQN